MFDEILLLILFIPTLLGLIILVSGAETAQAFLGSMFVALLLGFFIQFGVVGEGTVPVTGLILPINLGTNLMALLVLVGMKVLGEWGNQQNELEQAEVEDRYLNGLQSLQECLMKKNQ